MTKKEFIEMIELYKDDVGFISRIFHTALNSMPKNLRNEFIFRYYLKYVFKDRVIKLVHYISGSVYYFTSVAEAHKTIKRFFPNASVTKIYDCARHNKKHPEKPSRAYDHYVFYIEPENKEEITL